MSVARRAIHQAQDRQFILENEGQWEFYRATGGLPEQPLIDWSRQFLRPGEVFVDVGAHCGTWALQLASVSTPVFAYEAQWSTFCQLCGGIALNRLEAHVVATHGAVTDHHDPEGPCTVTLHVVPGEGGGSSLRAESARDVIIREESVRAFVLDTEQWRFHARGHRVGLVKIDVEGAELDVLRGAQRLITEDRPTLLVECWDDANRTTLFDFVEKALDYRIVPISGYAEMWLFESKVPGVPNTGLRPEPHPGSLPPATPEGSLTAGAPTTRKDDAVEHIRAAHPFDPYEPSLLARAPSVTTFWGGKLQRILDGLAPPTGDGVGKRVVASIPSVCANGSELAVAIRWINYQNDRHGWQCWDSDGIIRSVPEILHLDPRTLNPSGRSVLQLHAGAGHPSLPSWTRGFEDLRLVRLPDGWAAAATATDGNPQGRSEMYLLRFDDGHTITRATRLAPPAGISPGQIQKNWVPLHDPVERSLSFVYRPGTVIYETGTLAGPADDEPVPLLTELHGSSQAIALPETLGGGWLYVGHHNHRPPQPPQPFAVTHRLVWLDAAKRVRKASPRFSFITPGVEYCAGLALLGDELFFSFAVWERQLWMYRARATDVLKSLIPCADLAD